MEEFDLSEIQANHILDMPLRRLTALETNKLREELEELEQTIAYLQDLLADESKRRALIGEELGAIREKFSDDRRSQIIPDVGDMSLEDLIADEEIIVTVSQSGYVKAVNANTYRTQGRGGRGRRPGPDGDPLRDRARRRRALPRRRGRRGVPRGGRGRTAARPSTRGVSRSQRISTDTVSTCAVCGNRSTGSTLSSR